MLRKKSTKPERVGQIALIRAELIFPNPNQPRTSYNYDELQSLACSIRENGLLQPLTVRPVAANTYELISGGSLLIAADDGYALAESLEKVGIPAAVVGRATAGNDRIVLNGEEKRFLGPVRTDEIHKLI